MERDSELTRVGDLCRPIYFETGYLAAEIISVVFLATH